MDPTWPGRGGRGRCPRAAQHPRMAEIPGLGLRESVLKPRFITLGPSDNSAIHWWRTEVTGEQGRGGGDSVGIASHKD